MKTHGTKFFPNKKVHVSGGDQSVTSPPATQKDVDFFKEHEDKMPVVATETSAQPIPVSNGTSLSKPQEPVDPSEGPSVDAALSTSPTEAVKVAEPRKPTIGNRRPVGAKKGGLGAKKGLGAQRVKTNFSEIEAAAQEREKNAELIAASLADQEAKTKEEEEKRIASMRLAYQDLSVERKKQEDKLKSSDPKKAAQMERLGMGYAGSRGVSHSALSDMTTIEQSKPKSDYSESRNNRNQLDDDFEFGFSSGPPKYNDSPFGLKKEDSYSSWNSSNNSNKPSSWDMDRFETRSGSTIVEDIPSKEEDDRGRSRKSFEVSSSGEAQKKFGSAKAISSEQFFGPRDPDFEMKQNLSKFDGQSSISSADLFGGGGPSPRSQSSDYGGTAPDLAEIKEGVRQGVTKVAGKLSSLANGVISSIQDNYG
jgi:ADP-ribosylation factor GTPase-activating protein 2/3